MQNNYDITIIGSGLSGLVSAYVLSKEGYKVCVLEKNKQVGGCLQTFARDKCVFDVGVHYIGGLSEGQSLNRYFQYLGIMDDLKLQQMDEEAFDTISFEGDDKQYRMAQGYQRFEASLCEQFPNEHKSIKAFIQHMKAMLDKFPLYHLNIDQAYPTNMDHLNVNAKDLIASLTKDETLRAVLAGNNILYAGQGATTPFYLYAMVLNGYIESSWRCVDGGSQIARALIKQIRKQGGEIYKRKEVDQFVFSGNKIKAVRLTTGEEIETKNVVCSAHPSQLDRFVAHTKGHLRKAYLNRIKNAKPTPGIFSAHYVLRPNTVKYANTNYYHSNNKDMWNMVQYNHKNWPSTYLALTPKTSRSGIYAESIAGMSYMEFDEVKRWGNSFNTVSNEISRGADYEAFKEEKAALLLEQLYKRLPQLKGNVINTHSSTPLSFRDYIGCPAGSFYGFERDSNNPMRSSFAMQTRIPNLILTGQNVNVHGILGVTVSAILSCFNFVERKKLLTDIVSA